MATTLSQKRAYRKEYYEKNKEKMKAYQKVYQKKYFLNPENVEWKKNYMKVYSKEYIKIWQKLNPEKLAENQKPWRKNNLEKHNAYLKKYNSTPDGKKKARIGNWKQIKIKDEHFDELYDYYIAETHCMICDNEFKDSRDRHLDHDHETGEVRYICCRTCNLYILGQKVNSSK